MKFWLGFLAGWMASVPAYLYFQDEPDAEKLLAEMTAYRACMLEAQRCRMTSQDFIRYYELKHQLEKEHGRRNTKQVQ